VSTSASARATPTVATPAATIATGIGIVTAIAIATSAATVTATTATDATAGREPAPTSPSATARSCGSYYGDRYRAGHCPPGLAKKRNGCMPPGLAKQWRIGYPLPRDVRYYDAPGDIVLRFGMPPEGHRYVRVAADILLIAVGTGMVVDALEDLNRM
jgi:Protein of unknown function (DUF1236).